MTSTLLAARVLLAGHLARTSRTLRNRGEDGVSTLELVIIVLGLIAVATLLVTAITLAVTRRTDQIN
ncbi:hypothetical protein [Pseudonocardia sp.]|jgi:hypothetical protein|uniref:hypothetical protein n=1 Tax=Pseudonocardia sp. TaxID=60912 RepID=UPI003D0EA067|nr:hypothetical protein [Actinomycetota bacterium]